MRVSFVLLLLAITTSCSRPASTSSIPRPVADDAPGSFHGRVIADPMGIGGADWLERPERETTEQPEKVLDVLAIPNGSTVGDIGAGTGYFALRIARRVGPTGHVVATDLEPRMLEKLRDKARAARIGTIETVVATETDENLRDASLDLALLVDVYHELSHPSQVLAQLRRALKPDGRLVLVEYRGEDPAVAIKEAHKMTLGQVEAEVLPEGYRLLRVFEFLPEQRIIVFAPVRVPARTPRGPAPSAVAGDARATSEVWPGPIDSGIGGPPAR